MKKILFIGMTSNPGGLETYMMNIFLKLQGHDFQFYFINTSNNELAYSKFIRRHNGIIYRIPIKNNIMKYFLRYHIIKKFFKYHHDFNIIHINALSINERYWVNAAEKYGIKHIIFQSHESNYIHKASILLLFKRLWSVHNRYLLSHDNFVTKLAASRDCGKWMFGDKSNFQVIDNGIDTNYFVPNYHQRIKLKKKLNISGNKVVITTARIHKQKNYPKIIKVFKYINIKNPHTKLVIVGDGEELSYIKSMVLSLGLNDNVIFLGVQSKQNIARLLNVGDLMLMPSLYEGMPFSLIEAQSEGISAIVSKDRIPYSANLTGQVVYLSLNKSDMVWAKIALHILNKSFNWDIRLNMNNEVRNSRYNINKSICKIKNIYLKS